MGRKTLKLKNYTPEQIKSYFKKEDKYKIGIRLYAVYQVSLGMSSRNLEKLYNTSYKQITNWVHRFDEEGIEGLRNKPKSGRKPKVNSEQKEELKRMILKDSPEQYGYNSATWTGPMLIDWIKKKYGIEYKKAQIYNILKELGLTFQRGRGKYKETDKKKQEEFIETLKKNSKSKRG